MDKILILGFGNLDRADDGVAFYVINVLRRRLGLYPLPEDSTGLESLGGQTDVVFLSQLTPELLEIMASYNRVCFVDAHVQEDVGELLCREVRPEEAALTFTHHLSPSMLLALLQAIYQSSIEGYLVSIRGYNFDFHRHLSPRTQAQVAPAATYIMKRFDLPDCTDANEHRSTDRERG